MIRAPISRPKSRAQTKYSPFGDKITNDNTIVERFLLKLLAPFASNYGDVINRTSHPSGSSENKPAAPVVFTLAAKPPQKHLSTVLYPSVWSNLWLPLRAPTFSGLQSRRFLSTNC
jgi:hypothetical protein